MRNYRGTIVLTESAVFNFLTKLYNTCTVIYLKNSMHSLVSTLYYTGLKSKTFGAFFKGIPNYFNLLIYTKAF